MSYKQIQQSFSDYHADMARWLKEQKKSDKAAAPKKRAKKKGKTK